MEPIIVIKLCGGLGNQLFQYAAGRSLSIALGVELVLDLNWYDNIPNNNTFREYMLGSYNINARPATQLEKISCDIYHSRVGSRLFFFLKKWKHFREKNFDFDPEFFSQKTNLYLDGYWQSPKYFEQIEAIIRNELECTESIEDVDLHLCHEMNECNSVSIHIRRGDYITNKSASQHHGVCQVDYYLKAIKMIEANVQHPKFYIFSDDIQWAKDNLSDVKNIKFVDHNSKKNPCHDLRLMSNCRHHIIANSSFSWWGAWLGVKRDSWVIAPNQWFKGAKVSDTLLLNAWHKI